MFEPAVGPPGYQRSLAHDRRPHRTLDGYVCTLVYTDKHWRSFFEVIGQTQTFETEAKVLLAERAAQIHRPKFMATLQACSPQEPRRNGSKPSQGGHRSR